MECKVPLTVWEEEITSAGSSQMIYCKPDNVQSVWKVKYVDAEQVKWHNDCHSGLSLSVFSKRNTKPNLAAHWERFRQSQLATSAVIPEIWVLFFCITATCDLQNRCEGFYVRDFHNTAGNWLG